MSEIGNRESGVVLAALLIVMMPLMVLIGSTTSLLQSRSAGVRTSVDGDRALMAAESGVDRIVFEANTTGLVANKKTTVALGAGLTFVATTTDLASDGVDNDNDTFVDEADEDAFRVTVVGQYRQARRALVVFLRPMIKLPPIESAVSFQDFSGNLNVELDVSGNAFNITGDNKNIDGTSSSDPDLPGVGIVQPGTVNDLLSGLSTNQQQRITGLGGAPSAVVTSNAFDVTELAGWAQSVANNYIAPGSHTNIGGPFGDALAGDWQVTYAGGDVSLTGNLTGAGILVVTGDLTVKGNVSFTGLVVVTGDLSLSGGGSGSMIRGALIVGANATLKGTVDIEYSGPTISAIENEIASKMVVTGWREIAVPK